MKKHVLLTFDVEEFDTPLRHKIRLSKSEQLRIGNEGLVNIVELLQKHPEVKSTFYTTANFALHYSEIIKQISQKHEIASHTFFHSTFKPVDIITSKKTLEEIIQKDVYGFRMPNMRSFNPNLINEAGYLYDSSINPIYLPGKYNNFNKPLKPYRTEHFLEVPASAVPFVRFPLFWLAFKTLPLNIFLLLCKITIQKTGFLNLYFHPWEFAELNSFQIPSYIIQPNGENLINKLHRFINEVKTWNNVSFSTTIDFLKEEKYLS